MSYNDQYFNDNYAYDNDVYNYQRTSSIYTNHQ